MDPFIVILGILFLLCMPFYLLPTIIANARSHQNILAIFILNLFAGWTFWGWVAALVWACIATERGANRNTITAEEFLRRRREKAASC